MKLKLTHYPNELSEIGQNLIVKFAYCVVTKEKQYTNAHVLVKCRDFLGDVLDALENNRTNTIYGFTFNPKKTTINKKETCFVLEMPSETALQNLLSNISLLNQIETRNKVKKTTVHSYNIEGVWYAVTRGSNFWMKSIFNISLYTLLLKSCCYTLEQNQDFLSAICKTTATNTTWSGVVETHRTNEAGYVEQVKSKLDKIIYKLRAVNLRLPTVTGYGDVKTIHIIHNNAGFNALLRFDQQNNKLVKNINKLL